MCRVSGGYLLQQFDTRFALGRPLNGLGYVKHSITTISDPFGLKFEPWSDQEVSPELVAKSRLLYCLLFCDGSGCDRHRLGLINGLT